MAKTKKANNDNGLEILSLTGIKQPSAPDVEASILGAMMIEKKLSQKHLRC